MRLNCFAISLQSYLLCNPNPKNRNAIDWLNPLYKYSQGAVEDAANALGIKNVNKEDEVNRILEYMRGGGSRGGSGGGDNGGSVNRSSGDYDDITSAQSADAAAGNAAASSFAGRDPQTGGIDPAIQQQLDALTLQNTQYANQLAEREAYWTETVEGINTANTEAMTRMEEMMLQQQQAATSAQNLLQLQLSSTQTALQNQERMSANLARAFVPEAEAPAASAAYGDQRVTARKQQANSLNDLSIVTGVGAGNSLSGLQLA